MFKIIFSHQAKICLMTEEKYDLKQDKSVEVSTGREVIGCRVSRVRPRNRCDPKKTSTDFSARPLPWIHGGIYDFLCVLMRKHSLVFQNSMNLPPDKARLLRQYDNEKKWDLICDQVQPPQSLTIMSHPCLC